jgi:uncharacterized protein (TIGR03435 family)
VKRMILAAAAGLALHTASLQAQTVAGTWQGTLPVEQNARVVVKLSKNADGSLRGLFSWFDQNPSGVPFTSVTVAGEQVKLNSTAANVSFEGRLIDGGRSMEGTWAQMGRTFPLTLRLAEGDAVWVNQKLSAMVATDPAFEVATVKPTAAGATGGGIRARTRQFRVMNRTVEDLIEWAYQVRIRQIEGGPAWMREDHFDIAAEPNAPGQPSDEQYRVMGQKLLAERFGLKMHVVEKVFPVYRLVVAKTPVKMTPNDAGVERQGSIITRQVDENLLVQGVGMSMPELSNVLMNFLEDRQIVDETGLQGSYDYVMTVPMSAFKGGAPGSDGDPYPVFFAAVQQLGLKLETGTAPLKVIVIDQLEKPTAN